MKYKIINPKTGYLYGEEETYLKAKFVQHQIIHKFFFPDVFDVPIIVEVV